MHSHIGGHIFIKKNEQRLGSWDVEHGGGGVEEKGGGRASYERWGMGSEIFDDQLGRGSELFHQSS